MSLIRKTLVIYLIITCSFGALPPEVQKKKDYNTMQEFANSYSKIKYSHYFIDTTSYTISFDDCTVYFEREKIDRLPGWVGPASKLIFKSSTCDLNEEIDLDNLEDVAAAESDPDERSISQMTLEEYCLNVQLNRVTPEDLISPENCKRILEELSPINEEGNDSETSAEFKEMFMGGDSEF